jgi:hypothetical protein
MPASIATRRMPQIEQVAHRLPDRLRVVEADTDRLGRRRVRHHMDGRQRALAQELEQRRALADAAQRERVGAAGHEVHGLARLGVDVVAAGRDQQLQAGVGQAPLQRLDRLREDRVVDGREDRTDRAAAMEHQRPRPRMRHVAEANHRLGDAQAQRFAHRVGFVQDPRDRGRRDARGARDVVDGRQRGDSGRHGLGLYALARFVRSPERFQFP